MSILQELTSALQHLRKDLDHLQEMWPVLLNVINYENSINNSDILLLLYFNSCKEKVKVVINSLQNTVSDNCTLSPILSHICSLVIHLVMMHLVLLHLDNMTL